MSERVVRQKFVRRLLDCEDDSRAEEQLSYLSVAERTDIATFMVSVAKARLARIIAHLRRQPKFAMNLAMLSASTVHWICKTAARPPRSAEGTRMPSLQGVHSLCLLAASLLQAGSEDESMRRCRELVELTQKLLEQLATTQHTVSHQ